MSNDGGKIWTPDDEVAKTAMVKLNRLAKWRTVLAGRFLGTRSDSDQQCKAYKDEVERSILMRAEMNALTVLLIERGIFTATEFTKRCGIEADELSKMFEAKFPGFRPYDHGMHIDMSEAAKTMKDWPA